MIEAPLHTSWFQGRLSISTWGLSASATPSCVSVRVWPAGSVIGYRVAGTCVTLKFGVPLQPALLVASSIETTRFVTLMSQFSGLVSDRFRGRFNPGASEAPRFPVI